MPRRPAHRRALVLLSAITLLTLSQTTVAVAAEPLPVLSSTDDAIVFTLEEEPIGEDDPAAASEMPAGRASSTEAGSPASPGASVSGQSYDVDANTLPDDGGTAAAPVSDGPTITYNECRDRSESRTSDGWAKNHFQWCKLKGYRLVEADAETGEEKGYVSVTLGLFGYSNNLNRTTDFSYVLKGFRHFGSMIGRTFDFQIGARTCSQVAAAAYQRRPTAGVSGQNSCTVSAPVGSTWRSETDWKLPDAFVGQQLTSVGGRLPDLTARPTLKGLINAYEGGLYIAGTGTNVAYSPNQSFFRCDSATYIKIGSNSYPEGCVFQVDANLQYDLANPRSLEAVQHIDEAQHNPGGTKPEVAGKFIPGERATGVPLTRNQYGIRNTANTVTAVCQQYWPGYTTETPAKDCDEYPFASTYENARYAPTGYSAKAIIATQNRSGGSQLNVF